MSEQEYGMAQQPRFILPQLSTDPSFTPEEMADDLDGLQLSFPVIKIPGGGSLQFELPSDNPDDPDYAKTLEGVLLYSHNANAYWPAGSEHDENVPPLCQSVDGKMGFGEPGGTCADCRMNQYGTSEKGTNGKACKNMRVLYLLRSGESMPIQINLPPTSIEPYTKFVNTAFLLRQRRIFSGVVQISLTRETNTRIGKDYSVAKFTKFYNFEGEELAKIRTYATGFIEQVKTMNQQRAVAKEASASIVEGVEGHTALPDNGDHFSVGSVIDGEREKLPA